MVMVMTRIMSMEQQVGTRKNSLVNKGSSSMSVGEEIQ